MTKKYTCSCEATVQDAILGKICAHSLAQHLAYLLNIELSSPPIPFEGEPIVSADRKTWNGYTGPNDSIEIDF